MFPPTSRAGGLGFCPCIAQSGLYPFGADRSESMHAKVKVTEVGLVKQKAEMDEILETKQNKNFLKTPIK